MWIALPSSENLRGCGMRLNDNISLAIKAIRLGVRVDITLGDEVMSTLRWKRGDRVNCACDLAEKKLLLTRVPEGRYKLSNTSGTKNNLSAQLKMSAGPQMTSWACARKMVSWAESADGLVICVNSTRSVVK